MIRVFLNSLQSSEHPLLGPNLWALKTNGMLQTGSRINSFLRNGIHIAAILYVLTQYVELWIIRNDLGEALQNLSITMLSSICVVKAGTFVIWQKMWRDILDSISKIEVEQLSKSSNQVFLRDYIKYSRRVTYFYWSLVMATVLTVIFAPVGSCLSIKLSEEAFRNSTNSCPKIISSWVPFDKNTFFGYLVKVVEDSIICFYGGGIVAAYDTNVVALMSFFSGQLKLLKRDCSMIFGDGKKALSYQEALNNIRQCHRHHLFLVEYSKILNRLLSPVMFLYVIICSLMICSSAIQLTSENTTTMQLLWVAEYLMALVAQLFLYCWHSNEVLTMSVKLEEGVYASAWWTSTDVRMRRNILLLGGQLRRVQLVFTAGPFTMLSVSTFVTILKGSYSYYTFLSTNEEKG